MKEIILYNKDLLLAAKKKLKYLMSATHDKNHPGPYFQIVNKQIDYINILIERIKYLNDQKKPQATYQINFDDYCRGDMEEEE
jgi:hypothetical protein